MVRCTHARPLPFYPAFEKERGFFLLSRGAKTRRGRAAGGSGRAGRARREDYMYRGTGTTYLLELVGTGTGTIYIY